MDMMFAELLMDDLWARSLTASPPEGPATAAAVSAPPPVPLREPAEASTRASALPVASR